MIMWTPYIARIANLYWRLLLRLSEIILLIFGIAAVVLLLLAVLQIPLELSLENLVMLVDCQTFLLNKTLSD